MERVYRTRSSRKAFFLIFLVISVLLVFGAWKEVLSSVSSWSTLAVVLVLVVIGAVSATETLTSRVVLLDESIRYGSVFRSQSLHLDQIRYRREYEEYQDGAEGGIIISYLELVSGGGAPQSLRILKDDFDFDSDFWQWVLRIPDLEQLSSDAHIHPH